MKVTRKELKRMIESTIKRKLNEKSDEVDIEEFKRQVIGKK